MVDTRKLCSIIFVSSVVLFSAVCANQTDDESQEIKTVEELNHPFVSSFRDILLQTVDEINQHADNEIAVARDSLDAILAIKDSDRTFENTVKAFDDAKIQLRTIFLILYFIDFTHPKESMRDAARAAKQKIDSFKVDAFESRDIYRAFKAYAETNQLESLSTEQKYYFQEAMKEFERSGLALSDEEFNRVKKLKKELSILENYFESAISSDTSTISVAKEDLAGVAEDFIKNVPRNGDGTCCLSCDSPTIDAVLYHCHNEGVRKKILCAFFNRAYPENVDCLHTIIRKRHELALLLGKHVGKYESFAEFDISSVMAKTPERVEAFVCDLIQKVSEKEIEEFELLCSDLPDTVQLNSDGLFNQWDIGYVHEQHKKKHFDLDARKVAEYFPLEKTIKGIFAIYQQFLDVEFSLVSVNGVWHKDVQCIEIKNKDDGQIRGYVFLDLFPRKGKYSHACDLEIVRPLKKIDANGKIFYSPAVTAVIANFPESTAEKPSLLTHDDIIIFFHEFGHAMHDILSAANLAGHSAGAAVKADFIELPSLMFEEWMWNKDMLKMVSSHYQTGEFLPDKMIEKMIELKKFGSGYYVQRQGFLSLFSLACFGENMPQDTDSLYETLHASVMRHVAHCPEIHMQASFWHLTQLFYGPKFYSYLWSKVFALDLFAQIKKEGLLNPEKEALLNPEIGKRFIDTILGRGGSADPNDMLFDFLGRKPNQEAFLKDLGL